MTKGTKIALIVLVIILLAELVFYYLYRPASIPADPLSARETLTPEQRLAKEKALNNPELKKQITLTPEQIKQKQLLINSQTK